ncbi:MAG: hypothetical protein ACFFD4_36990 [Candidatus Odinarchaeota archaeon]
MRSKRNETSNWNRAIANGSFDGKLLMGAYRSTPTGIRKHGNNIPC